MLSNNHKITSLKYNDAVSRIMEGQSIDVDEARRVIAAMSFGEYHALVEATADIVPPSGRTISPQQQMAQPAPGAPPAGKAVPVPGQPLQPIQPGTQPPAAGQQPGQPPVAGQAIQQQAQQLVPPGQKIPVIPGQPVQPGQEQPAQEARMLQRLRELAGIREDSSGGATGAGSIAIAPAAMGAVKRRTDPVEESPSLEHPVAGRKTVVGATGPQASAIGKLSANNAVRGKKTASRTNNGLKK